MTLEDMIRFEIASKALFTVIEGREIFHCFKDGEPATYWFRFDPQPSYEEDLTGAFDIRNLPMFEHYAQSYPEPTMEGMEISRANVHLVSLQRKIWILQAMILHSEHFAADDIEVLE